jgi:cobalt-precorrin-5B (C1)-methyltransferase
VTGPELREPDLPRTAKVRTGPLRSGWTTGTCSAAAAKAATTALLTQRPQTTVEVVLPEERLVSFAVERCDVTADSAEAVVVKDAGDDPDVTHGAHLTATVRWAAEPGLRLEGGVGVGVVTKPGLGLEVGGAAINPVPRQMIRENVGAVVDLEQRGVRITISVPDGERRAKKTTNARLGILGGISILGTTGVVRPFSTESWRASVVQAVSVMAAQGEPTLVLATGGRTEKAAIRMLPDLPEVCFVEVGDFTGAALRKAVDEGLTDVVFVGMAGKLTKLASGVLMTHYTRSAVDPAVLVEVTRSLTTDAALIAGVTGANTARHAYEQWEAAGLLRPAGDALCRRVADVLHRFSGLTARVAMVDPAGGRVVAATEPGWVPA